jgi:hypothetical protein
MKTEQINTLSTAQNLLDIQAELGVLLMLAALAVFITMRG